MYCHLPKDVSSNQWKMLDTINSIQLYFQILVDILDVVPPIFTMTELYQFKGNIYLHAFPVWPFFLIQLTESKFREQQNEQLKSRPIVVRCPILSSWWDAVSCFPSCLILNSSLCLLPGKSTKIQPFTCKLPFTRLTVTEFPLIVVDWHICQTRKNSLIHKFIFSI